MAACCPKIRCGVGRDQCGYRRLDHYRPTQYLWGYNRYKCPTGAELPPDTLATTQATTCRHPQQQHSMSRIFTWLGIGLLTVLGKLPIPFVARFGEALGSILFMIPNPRREVVRQPAAVLPGQDRCGNRGDVARDLPQGLPQLCRGRHLLDLQREKMRRWCRSTTRQPGRSTARPISW
jgi:hypothetical protein